jgi:hypothetical protein
MVWVGGVASGGLFALPSNMGSHHQSDFAVVPEMEVKLGCDLTNRITVYLAFDETGGPAQPNFSFRTSTFTAQGLTVALRIGY